MKETRDYVKETYMIRGLVIGGVIGCIGLAVLCAAGRIAWIGIPVAIGLFGGMLIGMFTKRDLEEKMQEKENSIKFRFPAIPIAIIVAIIAASATVIAAGIGYAATTYQARHSDKGVKAGYTEKITYKKASGVKSATFSAKPDKGTMYIALIQNSGKKDTKYNVKWKLSSKAKYSDVYTFTMKNNKQWTSEKKCGKVKKGKKYNFCISKNNNAGTQSKIEADWLIK